MYKFINNQIRFEDFETPIGMTLHKENRWVKRAENIPWDEIEIWYASLFKNKKGNVAKPLRLALGACIIQAEYGYSDEETALQIQETSYLQFFCGYKAYDDSKLPFDPSLMVYFRKRLTPEILGEINELIIQKATQKSETSQPIDDEHNDDDKPEPPSNNGTLIVDATCAPSYIKYPQDTELLNEARENTETMITELHDSKDGKRPRTYRKCARKDYLNFARDKKRTMKKIHKAVGKQLRYLKRNLGFIDQMQQEGKQLSTKRQSRLNTIKALYEQQETMYTHKTHSVPDRIISLSQPWLRPIVRGKAKAPTEFGAKLDVSVVDGFARLEKQSFDAYNESATLQEVVERYKARTGSYPERVLADKIYRNRGNLTYCRERGIRLSGPSLGRPRKDAVIDKKIEYQDNGDRVEVEREFSLAKRMCGLGMLYTRLKETTEHTIALSILVLNLRKVLRTFLRLLRIRMVLFVPQENAAFVQ